ncbi:CD109 antigen-like isoform X2 [Oppia nitens]|uniref:CD109 antigen-like isoform X2 n=1 Tax=Oppia nitens TaxID=1686743 RepID=UPI0023D97B75|nr:CD109 antigen-like isoform X2 [Oppia nitens]
MFCKHLKHFSLIFVKLLIFAFITSHVSEAATSTYTVVAPIKLRPNADYHVSVSIYDSPAPVEVDVTVSGPSEGGLFNSASKTVVVNPSETRILNLEIGEWSKGNYKLIVTGRGGFQFKNETNLEYQQKSISVFIQTDKAIYKPGQLVQFRAVVVNPLLRPTVTGSIDIYIKDAKGNRIKQWERVFTSRGVVSQELQLSDQPILGDWSIFVEIFGQKFEKSFTVAEYVLPTFDVEVLLPPYATYNRSDVVATVKAIYTYGKPVKGEVTLTVQPRVRYNILSVRPLEQFQTKTTIDGSVDIPVNIVRDLNLKTDFFEREIEFFALVEEGLTGRKYNKSNTVKIHDKEVKVELIKTSKTFKPGLKYTAFLKVAFQDDKPVDENGPPLRLRYGFSYNDEEWNNTLLLTPVNGIINLEIYPPKNKDILVMGLRAEYRGQTYYFESIESAQSPSNNFIQIIKVDKNDAKVGEEIRFMVNSTEPLNRIVYEVMGRGDIVLARSIDVPNSPFFEFSLMATQRMAPNARIVCYYVRKDNQEVVADALNFDVDGVFQTQVTINTNVKQTKPGAMVNVRVDTKPNAYVGVLGIDQSVLLLKSGNDITQQDVINELQTYDTGKTSNRHFARWYRNKRSLWWPGSSTTGEIFDDSGVVILSNGLVHRTLQLLWYRRKSMPLSMPLSDEIDSNRDRFVSQMSSSDNDLMAKSSDIKINLRKHFPETWLWNNTIVGSDGSAIITSAIPDTITSWFISAFAMDHVTGLGIASNSAKVTVFRPFFVKLSLPYSIIRGESIALQAIVFNYFNKPIEAEVVMDNRNDDFIFTNAANDINFAEPNSQLQRKKYVSIGANDGVAVTFLITPKKTGYIDIKVTATAPNAGDSILRKLLVKPEGQTQYFNKAILVELKDPNRSPQEVKRNISIAIPNNAVPDSQRVSISGIGDILGPTVNNLDDLLRMPYGCGEQNMLNFVPNIVVLDYLSRANRLTPAIKSKAISNIESGYQRELTYRRDDGSFSAFGNSDRSGSTWLTAFVIKSFIQAKPLVDIDQKVIDKSIEWLLNRQKSDGSFSEPGEVHYKPMQGGGSTGSAQLAAYVLIAILQDKNSKRERKVEISKTESFIWNEMTTSRNPYNLAIITYALHLADSPYRESAFNRLIGFAKKSTDYMWWEEDREEATNQTDKQSAHFFYPRSNDIEMTSYALLTLVARSDLENAVPVLRWLISKQNSNGGFSSTQDTVIGIQALGGLAQRISTTTVSLNVDFNYKADDRRDTKNMRIDSNNAIILQRIELPVSTKYVEVEATGFGAAIVQISWQYNLAVSAEQPAFFLNPIIDKTSTDNYLQLSVCTHYKEGNTTNMAVMEVELPSGYVADVEALPSITRDKHIKRIDTSNGDTNVIIYFDRISRDEICLTVPAHRTHRVANNKPVPVTVYDYYNRQETSRILYEPKLVTFCDLCRTTSDEPSCQRCSQTDDIDNNEITDGESGKYRSSATTMTSGWLSLSLLLLVIVNPIKHYLY